jgi:hypothetical protein
MTRTTRPVGHRPADFESKYLTTTGAMCSMAPLMNVAIVVKKLIAMDRSTIGDRSTADAKNREEKL